jgi:hypothetical protein
MLQLCLVEWEFNARQVVPQDSGSLHSKTA